MEQQVKGMRSRFAAAVRALDTERRRQQAEDAAAGVHVSSGTQRKHGVMTPVAPPNARRLDRTHLDSGSGSKLHLRYARAEGSILDVLTMATRFECAAGYQERALAMWQVRSFTASLYAVPY